MKRFFVSIVLLSFALVWTPFAGAADGKVETPSDLVGRKMAVVIGSMMGDMTLKVQPGIEVEWFNDYNSGVEALRLGKVDGMPLDFFYARRWAVQDPKAFAVTKPYHSIPWGFFFAKGSPLRDKVQAVLSGMEKSGELKRILDKWSESDDPGSLELDKLDYRRDFTGKAGVFRFATPGDREPVSFRRADGIVGFDIDIVRRIAYELDMTFEIVQIAMGALVPAVQNGKAEMGGGGIAITEERAKQVDFSACYYRVPTVFLVRSATPAAASARRKSYALADLRGKHVAHMSSDFHKRELRALQPEVVFDPYSEYAFAFESLRKGKIAAISIGRTYADLWLAKYPGEFRIAFDYANDTCAFLLPKGSPLKAKLNAEIRKMRTSGECARIRGKWCEAAKAGRAMKLPAFPPPPADAPVVNVACSALSEPWCFVADGQVVGIDVEILQTVAHRLGWRLKTKVFSWGGMVDAVNAGRTDVACGGVYTGGNEFPTVDVSEKYADEKMCVMALEAGGASGGSGRPLLSSWVVSLRDSFIRTFVTEDRWRMMATGLGVTLLITFLASLLGTLLAFPLWLARTSRHASVSRFAKGYIALLQGTPVLVLLMVLFYLVFGKVNIDGIWVAVIGFALNFAAYSSEMLRSGIDSIPRGQTEAALALGYRPKKAFFRFILPQAVRAILPVYRGEIISVLKATSVVGYIAINDLTKASDLVRSRTYESFFPILTTAFIYFAVAWLLAFALERFGRRFDPARGRKGGAA